MQHLYSGMEGSDTACPALQDTSTGQLVAQTATKLGTCNVMRQNPWNACLALGHPNGVVTMWSPNVTVPLVRMLCHRVSGWWTDHATASVAVTQLERCRVAQPPLVSTPGSSLIGDWLKGPVRSIAIDSTGHHMVTSGVDGEVKVWDVRTFKPLHHYFSRAPATSLDISQQGLLAVGFGSKVQVQGMQTTFPVPCPLAQPTGKPGKPTLTHLQVWKDALSRKQQSPYMNYVAPGALQSFRFCPYEVTNPTAPADGGAEQSLLSLYCDQVLVLSCRMCWASATAAVCRRCWCLALGSPTSIRGWRTPSRPSARAGSRRCTSCWISCSPT